MVKQPEPERKAMEWMGPGCFGRKCLAKLAILRGMPGYATVLQKTKKNWNCRFQISVVFHPLLGMMILNEQCSKPRLVGDDRGFTK